MYLSNINKLCLAKVLACDFHYNLAAIQIKTDSPLPTATLRDLDDALPLHSTDHPQERSFKLLPHSNLFKIFPGTKIISLWRTTIPHNYLDFYSALFGYDILLLYFILYLYLVKNKTFRLQKVNVNMHIHICTALHSFRFNFFCLIRTTSLKGGLDFDELYWLRDPSDQPEPKIEEVIIFLSPPQLLALFKGSQSYCLLKLFDMASFMLLGFTSSA